MKLKKYIEDHVNEGLKTGPENDVVLSSRVRIARNLKSKPFPWRAGNSVLQEIWDEVKGNLLKQEEMRGADVLFLPDYSDIDKQVLIERHLISFDHAESAGPRGVVFNRAEDLSVMINEEDHLRIVSMLPGFDLDSCALKADSLDNALAKGVSYAFSHKWGFLSACPTNAGTGLRISCLVHLPALIATERIEPLLAELSKFGISTRGFYGEGTQVVGDIFQISNASTLGRSEEEILNGVKQVINAVINYERSARTDLQNSRMKMLIEDRVYRASAILTSARSIDYKEAMSLISRVKLGISLGLEVPWKKEVLNELVILSQPAHLQEMMGKQLSSDERDIVRARIIRKKLIKAKEQ